MQKATILSEGFSYNSKYAVEVRGKETPASKRTLPSANRTAQSTTEVRVPQCHQHTLVSSLQRETLRDGLCDYKCPPAQNGHHGSSTERPLSISSEALRPHEFM